MAKKPKKAPKAQDRRKRRTREHVIADQSLVHVQQFIANAGFTSEAVNKDHGYDVTVNTFDEGGFIEGGAILIQLKASEVLTSHADGQHYVPRRLGFVPPARRTAGNIRVDGYTGEDYRALSRHELMRAGVTFYDGEMKICRLTELFRARLHGIK